MLYKADFNRASDILRRKTTIQLIKQHRGQLKDEKYRGKLHEASNFVLLFANGGLNLLTNFHHRLLWEEHDIVKVVLLCDQKDHFKT